MSPSRQEVVSEIDLPVIDLDPDQLRYPRGRKDETEKLLKSLTDVGFCQIKGIRGYDVKELLKWVKWFYYEVPIDIKMEQLATKAFNPKNSNLYRGYFPVKPGQLSCKEGYDLGPNISKEEEEKQKGNPFVQATPKFTIKGMEEKIEKFYEVMYRHRSLVHKTADLIMSLIAEAGGENPNFFDKMFQSAPMHTYRPLRYPKRVDNIPKGAYLSDGRILSTPAHQDSGFLTILETFDFPGLEIEVDGLWYSVPPKPDTLVVNLGENMTNMSNGRFMATIHRVIDIGVDRFSIPFFYEPSCDTNIHTKVPKALLPLGSEKLYPLNDSYYPFGTFLLNKLPIYAEYADLVKNLPEWMREKYLEPYERKQCWAEEAAIDLDRDGYKDKK